MLPDIGGRHKPGVGFSSVASAMGNTAASATVVVVDNFAAALEVSSHETCLDVVRGGGIGWYAAVLGDSHIFFLSEAKRALNLLARCETAFAVTFLRTVGGLSGVFRLEELSAVVLFFLFVRFMTISPACSKPAKLSSKKILVGRGCLGGCIF